MTDKLRLILPAQLTGTNLAQSTGQVPNEWHTIYHFIYQGVFPMKSMLMAVMAVAVAVTFSAPAFAGDKKEEKKSGHVVVYGEGKDKDKGGKADDTFGDDKKKDGGK